MRPTFAILAVQICSPCGTMPVYDRVGLSSSTSAGEVGICLGGSGIPDQVVLAELCPNVPSKFPRGNLIIEACAFELEVVCPLLVAHIELEVPLVALVTILLVDVQLVGWHIKLSPWVEEVTLHWCGVGGNH